MAALILPHRWRQQPQGHVGLSDIGRLFDAVILPSAGFVNIGASNVPALVYSAAAGGVPPRSVIAGVNGYLIGSSSPADQIRLGSLGWGTISGVIVFTRPSANFQGLFVSGSAGSAYFRVDNTGTVSAQRRSAANVVTSTRTVFTDRPNVLAFCWVNSSRVAFALNGTLSSASTATAYSNGSYEFAGGDQAQHVEGLMALGQTRLDDSQLIDLSINPWQIFRPIPARIWVSASGGIAVSADLAEGADVLAANVGPLVDASSATTDGADVLAASVSVGSATSVSAGLVDGADVLAATVGPTVAATSATTDGADVLAGNVGPLVALSSTTTDGADVLSAVVSPLDVVAFSAALADGADVLGASIDTGAPEVQQAAGRGRRVAVERKGRIHYFDNEEEAALFESSLDQARAAVQRAKRFVTVGPGTNTAAESRAAAFSAQKAIASLPDPIKVEFADYIGISRRAVARAKQRIEEDDLEVLMVLL